MLKVKLLLCLFIFYLVLVSYPMLICAEPTITIISGNVVDGSALTVSGSDFGIKTSPVPLVFDNFDANDIGRKNGDEIRGNNCSHFGQWLDGYQDAIPTYTELDNRKGSLLCSYHPLLSDTDNNHAPLFNNFSDSNQPTLLIDFWTHFTQSGGDVDGSWQVKYWRIGDGITEADIHAHFQMIWWDNRPVNNKAFYEFFLGNIPTSPVWPSEGDPTLNLDMPDDGTWVHFTCMLKQGTDGNSDGKITIWKDGTKLEDTSEMVTYFTTDEWKRATFGWYLGNDASGTANATLRFDDIYIDNTWQSVFVGDASNWDGCAHREIQIPTAWSDNQITITLNQGSFSPCDTYYLYVVDANGNINSEGYPIYLASGSGEKPCPPEGVEIVK